MRKGEKRKRESSDDEKVESRMELKNKLNFVIDDFSISRLTQSNPHNNIFPHINEPTLEFRDTEQSNNLKLDDSLEDFSSQGLTARLSYQQPSSNHVLMLEEKVGMLEKELNNRNTELATVRKKGEATQKEMERLRKQLARRNQVIESQQKEMSVIKMKQSNSGNSCSNSTSRIDDSISNFCPELLSPEETVQLLNQLLKKVSKSSKMMKSLSSDASTKEILNKINKN